MKRIVVVLIAVLALAGVVTYMAPASGQADGEPSPTYGIKIPAGYRDWKLIAVDQLLVPGKADQLRAQLGNDIAIKAFKEGKVPCRDALDSCFVRRQQQSPGRSIPRRSIFRYRVRRECSVHGQGLKEVRRDGRLGVR
jgi:hypothetical protein